MSDTQAAAFVLMTGVAIFCWLADVVTSRRCDKLEEENRRLRRDIQRCVEECEVGRREKQEAWRWN